MAFPTDGGAAQRLKRSGGESIMSYLWATAHTLWRNLTMKWRIDSLYIKALYVVALLAGLVATAAAGWKWC